MGLFAPRCPVDDRERTWIDDNVGWLRSQFGDGPLNSPVILPTSEYFPPPYPGTDEGVRAAVSKVAGYMGVQAEVEVKFCDDLDHAEALAPLVPGGLTQVSGGGHVITIDRASVSQPGLLLAVAAHELGHVRLLGERRIQADRKDQEPLTDLLTIYLGMGIFTANAAFDFSRLPATRTTSG